MFFIRPAIQREKQTESLYKRETLYTINLPKYAKRLFYMQNETP